jgi:hypothetical protein
MRRGRPLFPRAISLRWSLLMGSLFAIIFNEIQLVG